MTLPSAKYFTPNELTKAMLPEAKHNDGEAIRAIAQLAQTALQVTAISIPTKGLGEGLPEEVPALLDPKNGSAPHNIKALIEAYRVRPERRTGTAKVSTLQSFIDLANRHKTADSVIFARTEWPEPKLTAVTDYHKVDGTPDYLKHRLEYAFPITDELKAWINGNGKLMEQADFAAFLEEHAAELAAPFEAEVNEYERLFKEKFAAPNDLIALSRNLEIFVGARVKRAERLSSGERTVEFVEEHTNGKGEKVDIPGIFMVAIPAFMDGQPVRIPARLRYRAGGGSISWGYQLYRWQFWLRNQVQTDLDRVAKETGLPAFEGAPEA